MQSVKRLQKRISEHNLTLVSAGVAFYAFLAFIPALIIVVSVYGRIAEPHDIKRQIHDFASALPGAVERFIASQISAVSKAGAAGVSITLIVALLIALWSASGGMAALITGIRVALGNDEPEGFAKKRLRAIALTIAAVALLCVIVFLVAALPTLVSDAGWGTAGRVAVNVSRWPLLLALMAISLGVIYRLAGDQPRRSWLGVITPGAIIGALVWLLASGGFAVYTANFARYSKAYGTLASLVVVVLWLYLSALAVLLGAETDGLDQEHAKTATTDRAPQDRPRTTTDPRAPTPVGT
jgi:membrane protein